MTKFGDSRIDILRLFGLNVRQWRLARHLTLDHLANRIACYDHSGPLDPGVLDLIEQACYPDLPLTTAVQIADALYVPLDLLFRDDRLFLEPEP